MTLRQHLETPPRPETAAREGLRARMAEAGLVFSAVLWLGVLLGVSFLATPVKFMAPSLDLPTALDVGRVTFALLAKVEWGLCALVLAGALLAQPRRALWLAAIAGLAILLAAQALWLIPVLDARVSRIIAGAPVAPSGHHLFYIVGEAAKAVILAILSIAALCRLICIKESSRRL